MSIVNHPYISYIHGNHSVTTRGEHGAALKKHVSTSVTDKSQSQFKYAFRDTGIKQQR